LYLVDERVPHFFYDHREEYGNMPLKDSAKTKLTGCRKGRGCRMNTWSNIGWTVHGQPLASAVFLARLPSSRNPLEEDQVAPCE
jgi:hypothetical protein